MSNPLGPSPQPQPRPGSGNPAIPRGSNVSVMNPSTAPTTRPITANQPTRNNSGSGGGSGGGVNVPQSRSLSSSFATGSNLNPPPTLFDSSVTQRSTASPTPASPNSARSNDSRSSRSSSINNPSSGGSGGKPPMLPQASMNTTALAFMQTERPCSPRQTNSSSSATELYQAGTLTRAVSGGHSTPSALVNSNGGGGQLPRRQSEMMPNTGGQPQQPQSGMRRIPSNPSMNSGPSRSNSSDFHSQTQYHSTPKHHPAHSHHAAANFPNWGPPLYPNACRVNPEASSTFAAAVSIKYPNPIVPFEPPPRPPQNIADNPEFFELYKQVWTSFHPIHDGIERPAVQALLPPRVFFMGKKIVDIGCGSGKLCRQFRIAHALSVTGIDSSIKMIQSASARELAEETDRLTAQQSGGSSSGIGSALKKFFRTTLTEAQLEEKLERERGKLQAKRDSAKLAQEDAIRTNIEKTEALAAATAEAERERERWLRETAAVEAPTEEMRKEHHSFLSGFKKLFKEKEKLKPSAEADAYKAEAEAKRLQREHEERIAAAQAKVSASAMNTPALTATTNPGAATTAQGSIKKSYSGNDLSTLAKVKKAFALDEDPFRREIVPTTSGGLPVMDSDDCNHPFIPVNYIHTSIEDWDTSQLQSSFHLVTCTMVMQFIWDLQAFARKVYSLLTPNGLFVCSVDHPVATACWGIHPIAAKLDERQPDLITHFPLDNYHDQGERRAKYYVDGVVKYHRRMDTYINTFLSVGLVLEKMVEPRASIEMEQQYPELKTWRRKPIFLCMRFRKPKNDDF